MKTSIRSVLLALSLGCVWLVGCDHDDPDTTQSASFDIRADAGVAQQLVLATSGGVPFFTLVPEGSFLPPGTVEQMTVTIPAGALESDTTVTIEVIDDKALSELGIVSQVIRIGPSDLQSESATVTMANFSTFLPPGTEEGALTLAYLGEGESLERITTAPFLGRLVGEIDHFGDVVLVELRPRDLQIDVEEDPLLGGAGKLLRLSVGSQISGTPAPAGTVVEFATDLGKLSSTSVTTASADPTVVRLTSAEAGTATVTATIGDTISQSVAVPIEPLPVQPSRVRIETSMGDFELQLFADEAPGHVANFLAYVEDGFYDGTIFHRVIPDFVIQGGGFDPGLVPKTPRDPIVTDAENGLQNVRGTVSLALSGTDANSGNSQFFINLSDNDFLDFPAIPGFTVFGEVVAGMDVVDAISLVDTTTTGGFSDVPIDEVVISRVVVVEE